MRTRDLSSHSPYVPGRGAEEVARELGLDPADLVKLSSNENPLGPSPDAVEAIHEAAATVGVYPKASHTDLTERIADEWGVAPAQVWVSPGADGSIDYLSRAMLDPGDRVLAPDPGFAYYAMSARYHNGEARTYHLTKDDDFELSPETVLDAYDGERIVYLTTPHNPTGAELSRGEVAEIADRVDDRTLVVVDEAYAEFSERSSAAGLLGARDDVAVLRTFSKAYGLAGLRIGYALVPAEWADAYARVNTPFAASEIACRAAHAALGDEEHLRRSIDTARRSREYLREHLDPVTWPSGGNFVLADVGALVEGGDRHPAGLVSDATQREGVIVRDCASFGLPDCVRISCGTDDGTERAVKVVNRVLDEV